MTTEAPFLQWWSLDDYSNFSMRVLNLHQKIRDSLLRVARKWRCFLCFFLRQSYVVQGCVVQAQTLSTVPVPRIAGVCKVVIF